MTSQLTLREHLRRTRAYDLARGAKRRFKRMRDRWSNDPNTIYDTQMFDVMRRTLRRDSCCVDVGAHCGSVLRDVLEIAPTGHHHAFEALPHLAERLVSEFPHVRVHQQAVSDSVGTAEFLFVESDPGYSGLRERTYDLPDPRITRLKVPTTTLDVALGAVPRVDFIKIDVEGAEYHVLKGGRETFHRCRPALVFEAAEKSTGHYGVTPQNLFDLLVDESGYRLTTMERWLKSGPDFTLAEFADVWAKASDYYFMAVPR